MNIYLIRHTAVNLNGVCYGQTDVPLKDTFEAEAEIVKSNLKNIAYDAVFSSPLSRCTKLAEYCGFKDEMRLYDRLKELHFGDWEMQRWDDLEMKEWETDWINNQTPNGESFQQMYNRVSSFFDELKTENYKTILVFTHGGVINCARVYFGQTTLKNAFDQLAKYGEVIKFTLT